MRIVIFGASGQTGRLLAEQALAAGHDVAAVTRRLAGFPVTHDRLAVVEADVHDGPAVDRVAGGADVVLSALGVPFARKQITVYSRGAGNIIAAMSRHGVKRLIVVSSSATEPHHHADGGFLLNRVFQPLVTATIGRTTYADLICTPQLAITDEPSAAQNGIYLESSLSMPRLTRTSAALTCS